MTRVRWNRNSLLRQQWTTVEFTRRHLENRDTSFRYPVHQRPYDRRSATVSRNKRWVHVDASLGERGEERSREPMSERNENSDVVRINKPGDVFLPEELSSRRISGDDM